MKQGNLSQERPLEAEGRLKTVEGETMGYDAAYLVRYGVMGHVGRFPGPRGAGRPLERGQAVVLRTDRGLEMGEVLVDLGSSLTGDGARTDGLTAGKGLSSNPELDRESDLPNVLRPAGPDDLDLHRRTETLRLERFATCRQILEETGWALDLLDVEPLLDQCTTVLHVLGPADVDLALLRARFRSLSDFDVVFESVGSEPDSERLWDPPVAPASPGRCGDCNCSTGGCGKAVAASTPADDTKGKGSASESCATSSHSACSSCGVTRWLAEKRPGGV
jgi:hypothetical protein